MITQDIMTIIGVNIALFGALATMVYWLVNRIDTDVKSLSTEIKAISSRLDSHAVRIDQLYQMFVAEMKAQSMRTDTLYNMFIDLLKDGKK